MKRIVIHSLLAIIVITSILSLVSAVQAANYKEIFNKNLGITAQGTGHPSENGKPKFEFLPMIGKAINILLSFIGVIFLALMIYGGYTWMLARGNDAEVTKAKNIIQNALIGLIIVFAAYAITYAITNLLSTYQKA
jgi:cbb3-type cytochrome oxidase subunit 3